MGAIFSVYSKLLTLCAAHHSEPKRVAKPERIDKPCVAKQQKLRLFQLWETPALIKEGAIPVEWGNKNKLGQKDTEARWTEKNNQKHSGFKNHIYADETHKQSQNYSVTDAAVHDS